MGNNLLVSLSDATVPRRAPGQVTEDRPTLTAAILEQAYVAATA
jgi:hypothetical protein